MTLRLALYQPDIPQNTGSMMRLAACLGAGLDIVEPCGFALDDKRMRRVAMDYGDHLDCVRHTSWDIFALAYPGQRRILLTTHANMPYTDFQFAPDDIVLMGRESAGVPASVAEAADARLLIPMQPEARSLNVSLAAAMVLGEALRQTG